ncbi:toxin [Candidatus Gottesmanbacteria bacterium]|nr:toxin [Candidatus Gottesmanbacteria bacterium]
MKYFEWNREKNEILKIQREISFSEVVVAIEAGGLLDIIQKMFVVNINNYVYLVPFAEGDEKYFLKTIFPSRKMTKKYLIKGGEK